MRPSRPRRLKGFSYLGPHRYFLTLCTFARRRVFGDAEAVHAVLTQILQSARSWQFEVLAYCFMPDHCHLLLEGKADSADLPRMIKEVKGRTGLGYARATGDRLWQAGYYERVVRRDQESMAMIGYILENPVRAGLVSTVEEYPFVGSGVYTMDEIRVALQAHARRSKTCATPDRT